jgi:hypothetical protein
MRVVQQQDGCLRKLTLFFAIASIVSFIGLMLLVYKFMEIKGEINGIYMNICSTTCGSPFLYDFNYDFCCTNDLHTFCVSKEGCKQDHLPPLKYSYNQYYDFIFLLSSIDVLFISFVVCLQIRARRGARRGRRGRRQAPHLPIDAQAHNNLVNSLINASQERMEPSY